MTEKKKDNKNVSVFARSEISLETDPLEEIFALNLGDFLAEHLISDELVQKISKKNVDKTQRLKEQLKELISIYSIDNTLKILGFSSKEDYVIYNAIAKTIKQMTDTDACHIFLSKEIVTGINNPKNHDLLLTGSSLNLNEDIADSEIGYDFNDESCVSETFLSGQKTEIKDCNTHSSFKQILILNEDKVKYYLAVPMKINDEKIGVIVVQNYKKKKLSKEFIELLSVTARLFAASMSLEKLTEATNNLINQDNISVSCLQNQRAQLTALIGDLSMEQQYFVENLARAVDAKSNFQNNHSHKVADLAREISESLGLNEKTKDLIYYAALLRNIGKITLPEELFNKKEKLSKEDWKQLQNHPNVGVSILMSINFLSEVVPYINYHKERWDGRGEPEGLKGQSIPLGSRIVALADAYCAMTSERSYRQAFSKEQALDVIQSESGSKWDPVLVSELINLKKNNN
ncbi:MAG: HD domain-containing protein [Candidatus Gastranaerophilales bacterium]|nr:HD domain-containing protein [Candidatus Gastranaerophilales bacterium]